MDKQQQKLWVDEQDSTPFQWQHEARQDVHPKWARHIVIEVKIHGHLWVLFVITENNFSN